jgi:hypothetical protein
LLSITVEEIISLADCAKLANELLDDWMFDEITGFTVIEQRISDYLYLAVVKVGQPVKHGRILIEFRPTDSEV